MKTAIYSTWITRVDEDFDFECEGVEEEGDFFPVIYDTWYKDTNTMVTLSALEEEQIVRRFLQGITPQERDWDNERETREDLQQEEQNELRRER